MWQKIKNWFKSVFSKENIEEAATDAKDAIVSTASETLNEFINNPQNQEAALSAILSVAKTGVTGNKALNEAVNILKSNGIAAGKKAANTLLRTLVQVVYAIFKIN